MARILHGHLYHLCFGLEHPRFAFLDLGVNELFHFMSGLYSKIQDSSSVTTLFSESKCLDTRRSFCPSFSNLGINIVHIFRNDPPNPLTIHVQFTCCHSNSKTTIAPHFFSHTLNILICSACG